MYAENEFLNPRLRANFKPISTTSGERLMPFRVLAAMRGGEWPPEQVLNVIAKCREATAMLIGNGLLP